MQSKSDADVDATDSHDAADAAMTMSDAVVSSPVHSNIAADIAATDEMVEQQATEPEAVAAHDDSPELAQSSDERVTNHIILCKC